MFAKHEVVNSIAQYLISDKGISSTMFPMIMKVSVCTADIPNMIITLEER
jgi:hypothetical protein